jgi:hypothetical protein
VKNKKSPRQRRRKVRATTLRLGAALGKLASGQSLDHPERLTVVWQLRLLLDGFDPRPDLGITPKQGPRPRMLVWMKRHAIAGHYWAFRQTTENEKSVACDVACAWRCSISHVRAAATEHKDSIERSAEANGWKRVSEWSKDFLKYSTKNTLAEKR